MNFMRQENEMPQTITISLSDSTYRQLKKTAELSSQPLDRIIEQSLAHSLPPLLEEIPAAYQGDIFPLLKMGKEELEAELGLVFPPDHWENYEALLARKKLHTLTAAEQRKLDKLRREADVLTFRKGYAAVLLRRRGYLIPGQSELPAVQ